VLPAALSHISCCCCWCAAQVVRCSQELPFSIADVELYEDVELLETFQQPALSAVMQVGKRGQVATHSRGSTRPTLAARFRLVQCQPLGFTNSTCQAALLQIAAADDVGFIRPFSLCALSRWFSVVACSAITCVCCDAVLVAWTAEWPRRLGGL